MTPLEIRARFKAAKAGVDYDSKSARRGHWLRVAAEELEKEPFVILDPVRRPPLPIVRTPWQVIKSWFRFKPIGDGK